MSRLTYAQKRQVQRLKVDDKKHRDLYDSMSIRFGTYDDVLCLGPKGLEEFIERLRVIYKFVNRLNPALTNGIITEDELSKPDPESYPDSESEPVLEAPIINQGLYNTLSELYDGRKGQSFKFRHETKAGFRSKLMEDPEVLKAILKVKSIRLTFDAVFTSISLSEFTPNETELNQANKCEPIPSIHTLNNLIKENDRLISKIEKCEEATYNLSITQLLKKNKIKKPPAISTMSLDQLKQKMLEVQTQITALKPKSTEEIDKLTYTKELEKLQSNLKSYTSHHNNFGCEENIKNANDKQRIQDKITLNAILHDDSDEEEWLPESEQKQVMFEKYANVGFTKHMKVVKVVKGEQNTKLSAENKALALDEAKAYMQSRGGWEDNEDLKPDNIVKSLSKSKNPKHVFIIKCCINSPFDMTEIFRKLRKRYIDTQNKKDARNEVAN